MGKKHSTSDVSKLTKEKGMIQLRLILLLFRRVLNDFGLSSLRTTNCWTAENNDVQKTGEIRLEFLSDVKSEVKRD